MGPTINKTSPSPPGSRKYIKESVRRVSVESPLSIVKIQKKRDDCNKDDRGKYVSHNEASAGIETAVNPIPGEPKGKAMRLLNSIEEHIMRQKTSLTRSWWLEWISTILQLSRRLPQRCRVGWEVRLGEGPSMAQILRKPEGGD
jgi:hypothetical protein